MAVDMFLKIEGIPGESSDGEHKDEIDVLAWSWGETQFGTARAAGGGAGKVNVHDFHFVLRLDKSTPVLFEHCATGQRATDATLTLQKGGRSQLEYLKIKMTDVLISGIAIGEGGDQLSLRERSLPGREPPIGKELAFVPSQGSPPTQEVTLNFQKIEIIYTTEDAKGVPGTPVRAAWDVAAGRSY